MREPGRAVLTPTLLTCVALSVLVHVAVYALNVALPLHLVALGGSNTQVGILFSVSGIVSMFLRPVAGGWADRCGIRAILVPGVVALAVTSATLPLAGTPGRVIALMVGLGSASALISTAAGVLAAGGAAPAVRGEALSIYYLAAPVAMVAGAPAGLALMQAGGAQLNFAAVTAVSLVLLALALLPTTRVGGHGGAGRGLRLGSRQALGASVTMGLVALGSSSLYAFVPLYALRHGLDAHVGWFFALYSAWLLACRVLLRGLSDRLGHERVLVAAMAANALGYFVLALPPTPASLAATALLLGAGASVFFPSLVALVIARTPAREHGLAIGTLSGAFDAGIVVGSALIGAVVERFSFGPGFGVAGGAAVAGLAFFALAEHRRRAPLGSPGPARGV